MVRAMTPDLLVVVHPWTTAPGSIDAPATTAEQEYVLCSSACSLFINARVLRDMDGVVVVVPPVGFVVVALTSPVISEDVMSLELRTMRKTPRYPANIFCLSVPVSAVTMTACPI